MKLTKIEIAGFKSFRDKAIIPFSESGINAILGPNGCGKSNVVDALKWGLGEQGAKSLRGTSMQDVIFSGTETSNPVGFAQVSLFFSNAGEYSLEKYKEFKEIQITRKYYRSGESLYLINQTPCRLKDIREIFLDTGIGGKGYSIIEQGRVSQIVTGKPEDLRAMVDEAAGIMKFKTKKNEAGQKLKATKQNLIRIYDLLRQLEEQAEKIHAQVRELRKYHDLQNRIESAQKKILAFRRRGLQKEAEEILSVRERLLNERSSAESEIAIQENRIQNLDIRAVQIEHQLEESGKKIGEISNSVQNTETEIRLTEQSLVNLREWQSRGKKEKEKQALALKTADQQIEEIEKEKAGLQTLHESQKQKLRDLEEQKQIPEEQKDSSTERFRALDEKESRTKETVNQTMLDLKVAQEKLNLKSDDIPDYLETRLEDEIALLEKRIEEIQKNLEANNQQKEEALILTEEAKEQIRQQKKDVREKDAKVTDMEAKLHLDGLEIEKLEREQENLKAADEATEKAMHWFAQHPEEARNHGFLGRFPDLIQTREDAYPEEIYSEVESEILRLKSVLVFADSTKFTRIFEILREQKIGKIELLFTDLFPEIKTVSENIWLRPAEHCPEITGFCQEFNTLKIQNIESFDSENISFFDSGTMIGIGYRLLASGLIEVNSRAQDQEDSFHAIRIKIKQTQNRRSETEEKIQTLKQQSRILNEEIEENEIVLEDRIALNENLHQEIESEKRESDYLQKQYSAKKQDLQVLQKKKSDAESEENLVQIKETAQNRLQTLDELLKELHSQKQKLREETEEVSAVLRRIQEEIQDVRLAIKDTENRLEFLNEKEKSLRENREKLSGEADENQDSSRQKADEEKKLHESMEEKQKLLKIFIAELGETKKEYGTQKSELEKVRADKQGHFDQIKTLNLKLQKTLQDDQDLQVRLAKLEQERQTIEEELQTEYMANPEEIIREFDPESFDLKTEKMKLEEARRVFKGLNNIHFGAEEDYQEVQNKVDFLSEQKKDLEESSASLENSIQKMDEHSVQLFQSSFDTINQNLKKVFPLLFSGGEASLVLTDPENLLETGIDIVAKPPGKKLRNLNLMSGGEKAMTALALIFSIFFAKPSPMCVLDEVDAPLDDANIGRYAKMLETLKKDCQFIVITHNKKTMESADRIYGVTMQEKGVSRIVSVDFEETERFQKKATA